MDAEGGGTGAGQAAQPVRDGLPRLQGTERNTAALPHKECGGDRIGTPQTKKAARTGSLYLVTQPDYRAILTLKFRVPSF